VDFFDYNPEFDIEDFLKREYEREKQCLEKELDRIDEQLEQRDRIHEEAIKELESKRDWYIERLELLYKRGTGKQNRKREKLKTRIEELCRAVREEKRSHWHDRQELQREKRELLRELNKLSDSDMLSELLRDPDNDSGWRIP